MTAETALPAGLLLAFYGDDFTGSTDAMEVMAFAGLPTVLFVKPPTAAALERFRHHRGIGIAGTARSKSPQWMDEHLPPVFQTLFSLQAPITQYKVCSTFDSSPAVGSIGRAIDLALPLAAEAWSPLVVGAPQLQRWQAFGALFAGVGAVGHRLDRHPTMSRHPMTPMSEADLTRHLAQQTGAPIALVDAVDLARGGDDALRSALTRGRIVSFDVTTRRPRRRWGGWSGTTGAGGFFRRLHPGSNMRWWHGGGRRGSWRPPARPGSPRQRRWIGCWCFRAAALRQPQSRSRARSTPASWPAAWTPCRSPTPGMQMVLKGGQVGGADFFLSAKKGS